MGDGYCPGCLLRDGLGGAMGAEPDPDGRRFGPYELLEKIGQGGMGVVYRARQVALNRVVAVKVLPFGGSRLARTHAAARFAVEATVAAGLQHPHIVAIHDVGEQDGQPYYSMDYIEGRTLTELVREHPLPARRAAAYAKAIAGAVQYAHEHGVLHRDLKPSNILIDAQDQPRITDFGLAKRLGPDAEITLSGQVLGSPNFMAPEQAGGRSQEVGPAADIYALGALLYHMLTRQPPFQAQTLTTLLKQVIEADPLVPRLLNPSIPRDLETICLRCLEKEPGRRYASAAELEEELGRFLDDEPIRARPVSRVERAWRWCRRQPIRAGLIAALVVTVAFGTGAVLWQWRVARRNARAESVQRETAERVAYASKIQLVQGLIDDQQFGVAQELLLDQPESHRGWEWGWLLRACHEDVMTLAATNGMIFAEFSPDGREVVAGGFGPTIFRWDLASGRELEPWPGHTFCVGYSGFSPDGRRFVSAGWNEGIALIRDARTGRVAATMTNPAGVFLATFSPDSRRLLTTASDGRVQVWNAETGAFTGLEATYGDPVWAAAFSPDGNRIAYAGGNYDWADSLDTSVRVWDLASGEVRILGRHSQIVGCVGWSPDGRLLASSSWSGEINLWDPVSGTELPPLPQAPGRPVVLKIVFSPDGRHLAAAGGGLRPAAAWSGLYDVPGRRLIREYHGHARPLCDVRFSADGQLLATASMDRTVRIWRVEPAPAFRTFEGHDHAVWTVAYSSDGARIVTGGFDNTAKVWDARTGRRLRTLPVGCPVTSLALSPDGRSLATPGPRATAWVWDLGSDREPRPLAGHDERVEGLAWSSDGRWIASASRDGTARIWDPIGGHCVASLTGHVGVVRSVCFSPGLDWLATGGTDGTVRVWDTAAWQCRRVYTNHSGAVSSLGFNPRRGTLVASGGDDGLVRIRDVVTGADQGTLPAGSPYPVLSLAFSPDGRRLATASNRINLWNNVGRDSRVLIWDLTSGQQVQRLFAHENAVFCVAFSPEGRQLASGGADNTVRLREAFPWETSDFPGDPQAPLAARIESFKRRLRAQPEIPSADGATEPERRVVDHIMGEIHLPPPGSKTRPLRPIPERSPECGPGQVDLSAFYNLALEETWPGIQSLDEAGLSLASLPAGIRHFAGIGFDVRGLVHLRRAAIDCENLPDRVVIPVNRSFQRLHVLHGARWPAFPDQAVAAFTLTYADGTLAELPILYGRQVCEEGGTGAEAAACLEARVVWEGRVASTQGSRPSRLFLATFANPRPDQRVTRIEYLSRRTRCAPFLVALTIE